MSLIASIIAEPQGLTRTYEAPELIADSRDSYNWSDLVEPTKLIDELLLKGWTVKEKTIGLFGDNSVMIFQNPSNSDQLRMVAIEPVWFGGTRYMIKPDYDRLLKTYKADQKNL